MTNWHVGQRVRCKDASLVNEDGTEWGRECGGEMVLVKGGEYTIRNIFTLPAMEVILFRLEEIKRLMIFGHEKGWRSSRFEPIQTTSIDSLRALLNPSPEEVERVMNEELV